MKNLGQMMKQAQEMQAKMAELQEQLTRIEVTGAAGGGMVQVTLNGKGEMRAVTIDPVLVDPGGGRTHVDGSHHARHDAQAKAEAKAAESMRGLPGGLGLAPGCSLPR